MAQLDDVQKGIIPYLLSKGPKGASLDNIIARFELTSEYNARDIMKRVRRDHQEIGRHDGNSLYFYIKNNGKSEPTS